MVDLKEGAVLFPVENFVHDCVSSCTLAHRPLGGGVNKDRARRVEARRVFAGGWIVNAHLAVDENTAGKHIRAGGQLRLLDLQTACFSQLLDRDRHRRFEGGWIMLGEILFGIVI